MSTVPVLARMGKTVLRAAILGAGLLWAFAAPAQDLNASVQPGVMLVRALERDPGQAYLLYIPRKGGKDAPIFVTVHGISRNAIQQAYLFADFAEHYGVVMIAPYFPEPPFWDYQFMGRTGRGARADLALDRIVEEVGRLTQARTDRLYLFGYSGGGQFVHRYVLAHPERVVKLAIGAAGWYTFPDASVRYPYGLRISSKQLAGVAFTPQKFLAVPTRVFVGDNDVEQDPSLNKSADVVRLQGATRVDRAKNWTAAMKRAALQYGLDTDYSVELLPNSAHSFAQSMAQGGMGQRVFSFFFPH